MRIKRPGFRGHDDFCTDPGVFSQVWGERDDGEEWGGGGESLRGHFDVGWALKEIVGYDG